MKKLIFIGVALAIFLIWFFYPSKEPTMKFSDDDDTEPLDWSGRQPYDENGPIPPTLNFSDRDMYDSNGNKLNDVLTREQE